MLIRDDRGKGRNSPPTLPRRVPIGYAAYGEPSFDAVLIDCRSCGRSHFVTVDECPSAAVAAKETAATERQTVTA